MIDFTRKFRVAPGSHVKLAELDPGYTSPHPHKKASRAEAAHFQATADHLQFRMYAEGKRSLLICLQALDAGGKDGTIRHVFGSMNPQGCRVVGFKEPSAEERAHDFLWRIERQVPRRGEVVIFNRSHYEDVLIARVLELVPRSVWSKRYAQINDFERRLAANGTHVLKFFLHISKKEQLVRFKQRIDDPERHWKISEADYAQRTHWDSYEAAYEDVLRDCSTEHSPWFIIPSDHKWFRNLAISQIVAQSLESLDLRLPEPTVDLAAIRKKYHAAVERSHHSKKGKGTS